MDAATFTLAALSGSALLALMAVLLVPRRVSYAEQITIDAPAQQVYDNIRYQHRLMQWSAWPTETGSTCTVEGPDGRVGARTIFISKGSRFGHQEITALDEGRRVQIELTGKGPPQRPKLEFELGQLSANRTQVTLHFSNDIARPFNVILRLIGVVRWTRRMHVKDLNSLKRFSEPPYLTYTNELAVLAAVSRS